VSKEALKKAIDKMVEESIRRILPNVLNEVLLRTIAGAGIVAEAPKPQRAKERPMGLGKRSNAPAKRSLREQLLDETAGTEFYQQDPDFVAPKFSQPLREEPASQPAVAQRIQSLPPMLQEMAADIDMSEFDGGEMWEDGELIDSSGPGPKLESAAAHVGIDFDRIRRLTEATSAPKAVPDDSRSKFEEARINRMREKLDSMKIGE